MKTSIFLIFVVGILLASCSVSELEDFVVGDNFISDDSGIMMIDSMKVNTSTVKFDSIPTNSTGRLLVGSNYNELSGYKSSASFFEVSFTQEISFTTFVYDSLCVVLGYDGYYSGDTTATQTISLHQLKERMELQSSSELYSISKFAYNDTPLGSVTLQPKPNSKKNLSFRLSDQLGNRLAEMIKAKKDTLRNEELFKNFFKGLVLKTEGNVKGAAIGFSAASSSSSDTETTTTTTKSTVSAPEIRLYYHLKPNPDNLSGLYYKLEFSSSGIYFTQVSEDMTGSPLENITSTENEISSSLSGNQVLIQSGSQMFAKVNIPYVDNLLMIGKNSGLVSAQLTLYPVKGTYGKTSDLPDSLYVYSSDRKNKLTGQLTIPGTSNGVYARLKIVKDVEETVSYQADVTTFIDTELKEALETNRSVIIGFGTTESAKSLEHVIIGGTNSGKYAPQVKVYYYHN